MALSDELEALAKRHGALSYRNRADTQHPAYGFTEDGLNGLIGEVLAKWGTPAPVGVEPAAWKHDCAALLMNDVELWIDACPHCGKPRNAPQPVGHKPLTHAQAKALVLKYGNDLLHLVYQVEVAHGIKGGQHGTE